MPQLPIAEIIELAIALIAVGALAGFLAGLFGVGGGAILVPVLYELFRIMDVPLETRMPLCVGTSLAIIIPTAVRSYLEHRRHGSVDMNILRTWTIPILIGVTAGSLPPLATMSGALPALNTRAACQTRSACGLRSG